MNPAVEAMDPSPLPKANYWDSFSFATSLRATSQTLDTDPDQALRRLAMLHAIISFDAAALALTNIFASSMI
jgi:uncharacterized membrane protein